MIENNNFERKITPFDIIIPISYNQQEDNCEFQ